MNPRSISPRVARTHRCPRATANNNVQTYANTHVAHAASQRRRRRRRARRRVLPEWIQLRLPLIVSRDCRRGTPSPPISHVITLACACAYARARVHVVTPSSQARFDRRNPRAREPSSSEVSNVGKVGSFFGSGTLVGVLESRISNFLIGVGVLVRHQPNVRPHQSYG